MAKVQKKASVHSRSARRAASPSIDTDKSLKEIKPPATSTNYHPAVLAIHQGAGVSKKSKNGRKAVLSAKAKARQEKVLDRAEAVMDQKARKIERSKGRARNVQDRAETWEQRNKRVEDAKVEAEALQKARAAYLEAGGEEEEDVEEEEMADEVVNDSTDAGDPQDPMSTGGDVKMDGNAFNSTIASTSEPHSHAEEVEEEIL